MSERQKRTEAHYRTVDIVAVAEQRGDGWQGLFKLADGLADQLGGEPQETPEDAVAEALVAAVHLVRHIFDEPGQVDDVGIIDPDPYIMSRVASLLELPTA